MNFEDLGRLPSPLDNVAIAIRQLDAGTTVEFQDQVFTLSHGILEGHRFAVRPIPQGEYLTSWGMPFGTALRPIEAGEYVCNAAVIQALGHRDLPITLPGEPNFTDEVPPFIFDESGFSPAEQLSLYPEQRAFLGFRRSAGRGAGTRNFVILLGTTSLTAGFVRMLEKQLQTLCESYSNIDGIVAVTHTEGGHTSLNNRDLLLRTLAGWMVHPNVGAVLAVDYGTESLTNAHLHEYMLEHGYPLNDVAHHFMSMAGSLETNREHAITQVKRWLEQVNATQREAIPLSELKIGLQCGGSDAFSGISANPLVGWASREIIRHGGSANLAETDELVNAEGYVLGKVRDAGTARRFLATLDRFKTWAGWHGHSIFGNPSGGNLLRGLYNIYLKSLGAAIKKDPALRLDYVIEYGEPMREAGFYFMDSPGNDLESVAGQVASGCNLIYFTTGNGSITNFPFVPTIKIITTTQRYQMLSNEMDVNAGAYLTGTPLDELGAQLLDLSIEVASGRYSVGEQAGHSQAQIWRNWQQVGRVNLENILPPRRTGNPIPVLGEKAMPNFAIPALKTSRGVTFDHVGLILPTSLCSGQVARMIADHLNRQDIGQEKGISRFLALAHTEGCGFSGTPEYIDTLLGYLTHPLVAHCLLLEHGCETTHNGYMRTQMLRAGLDPDEYGWASIQLDRGIAAVQQKIQAWFEARISEDSAPVSISAGLESLRLGLLTQGDIVDEAAATLADLNRQIVLAGGTVILPSRDNLLEMPAFTNNLVGETPLQPTLNFAQHASQAGFHIMENPSDYWGETLTGLGAAGVHAILTYTSAAPLQAHPLVPVLYATMQPDLINVDTVLAGNREERLNQLLDQLGLVLSRQYVPYHTALGNVDFQITRGVLGVSL